MMSWNADWQSTNCDNVTTCDNSGSGESMSDATWEESQNRERRGCRGLAFYSKQSTKDWATLRVESISLGMYWECKSEKCR